MNPQTNLLTNIAPQTWKKKRGERVRDGKQGGKGAKSSNVFAVCLSKHIPKSSKDAREYSEAGRDNEEKTGREATLSLIIMNKLG